MGNTSTTIHRISTDPQGLQELTHLAKAYLHSSEYNTALSFYKKLYKAKTENLVSEDKSLAGIYKAFGTIYCKKAMYNKSLECLKKALELGLGDTTEDILFRASIWKDMGDTYSAQNVLDYALGCYEKALGMVSKLMMGDGHVVVLSVYKKIGEVYKGLGKYDEAVSVLNTAINLKAKKAGENGTTVADINDDIGDIYRLQKKDNEALDYYMRGQEYRVRVFGDDNECMVKSFIRLSLYYEEKGQHEKALRYCDMMVKIGEKREQDMNKELLFELYATVGSMYLKIGQYEKAILYHKDALKVCEEIFGSEHPLAAKLYDDMGHANLEMRNLDMALECYNEGLRIKMKVIEEGCHVDMGVSYENIGKVYKAMGKDSDAIENFKKAIDIRRLKCGEEDDVVSDQLGQQVNQLQEELERKKDESDGFFEIQCVNEQVI